MGPRSVEAGRAFLRYTVDSSEVEKSLRNIGRRVARTGKSITSVGAGLLGAGAGIAGAFIPAIKAASDLEETVSKFNVVFADQAEEVRKWSDTYSSEVGRARSETLKFLAGFQDLLVPIGFETEGAVEASKTLTQLAVDLASFNNLNDADVVRDLQAALTGSSETMKKYGVVVNEAAVKQELFNTGLDPKAASEAEKAQARLNIILRDTTAAQGDAIRTAGSFANSYKALQGTITDAFAAIGKEVLPVITPFVQRAREAVLVGVQWVKQNRELIPVIFKVGVGIAAAGAALVAIGGTITAAGAGFGGLAAAVSGVVAAVGFIATPVGGAIAAITALGAALFVTSGGADKIKELFTKDLPQAFGAAQTFLGQGNLENAFEVIFLSIRIKLNETLADMLEQLRRWVAEAATLGFGGEAFANFINNNTDNPFEGEGARALRNRRGALISAAGDIDSQEGNRIAAEAAGTGGNLSEQNAKLEREAIEAEEKRNRLLFEERQKRNREEDRALQNEISRRRAQQDLNQRRFEAQRAGVTFIPTPEDKRIEAETLEVQKQMLETWGGLGAV